MAFGHSHLHGYDKRAEINRAIDMPIQTELQQQHMLRFAKKNAFRGKNGLDFTFRFANDKMVDF